MKNIKNLKYYLTASLLATTISLASCGVNNNEQESNLESSIKTISIINTNNDNSEIIDIEKEEIVEENKKIENITKYNIDDLYLNFCLSKTVISNEIDVDAFKTISLNDLINYYGYNIEYDKDSNTLNSNELVSLAKSIRDKVDLEIYIFKRNYIPIDEIGFYVVNYIDNSNLNKVLYAYNKGDSLDNDIQINIRNQFKEKYKDLIVIEDEVECIDVFNLALLDGNLNQSKLVLPIVNDEEINIYKDNIINSFNLNLEDMSLKFDPNSYSDIDEAFMKYAIYNKNDIDIMNNDYTSIILQFIALNNKYINSSTLNYIITKYNKNELLFKMSHDELRDYAINNYVVTDGQEYLAASNGYSDALIKINDIKYKKEFLISSSREDICDEVIILKKIFVSLKNSDSIDSVIINSLLHNYIVNVEFPKINNQIINLDYDNYQNSIISILINDFLVSKSSENISKRLLLKDNI